MKLPRSVIPVFVGVLAIGLGAAVAVALSRRNDSSAERARADRMGGLGERGNAGDLLGDLDIAALTECLGADDLLENLDNDPPADTGIAPDRNARSQIRAISRQVEEIRKLHFRSRYKVKFLPPKGVAARAAKRMLSEYPAEVADWEARVLAALGAIPPDTDLRQMSKELLESQVAGFYVPATDQLVVPSTNPRRPLAADEKIVLAHELEHAVVDQTLGLPLPGRPDPSEADATLAALSVAEGDATLTMQRYALQAIPLSEQFSMLSDPTLTEAQDAIEDIPHFLAQQLTFPYIAGLEFDCDLFTRGGWRAVNRAYENPPSTSAQVMFPDRYRSGEDAIDVRDPARPGQGWTKAMHSTFGAAHLQWLFEAPGDDTSRALDDPEAAAGSWAGGEVHLFIRGDSSAVALVLKERADGKGLCDAVTSWYESAFDDDRQAQAKKSEQLARDGAAQAAVVRCTGREVRVGIARGLTPARSLVR
jgi:hypothetical protein